MQSNFILYSTSAKIRALFAEALASGLDKEEAMKYAKAASLLF